MNWSSASVRKQVLQFAGPEYTGVNTQSYILHRCGRPSKQLYFKFYWPELASYEYKETDQVSLFVSKKEHGSMA